MSRSIKRRIENALYDVEPNSRDVRNALVCAGITVEPTDDWLVMDEIYDEIEDEVLRIKYLFYAWHNGKRYFVTLLYDFLDGYRWSAVVTRDSVWR